MNKNIIITLLIIIIFIGSIYLFYSRKPSDDMVVDDTYRLLEDALDVDFTKVDNILTSSGNYGKIVEITDKDEITEYLNMFKEMHIKKISNKDDGEGFGLETRLYYGEEKVASFIYGNDIIRTNGAIYSSDVNFDIEKINDIEIKYNLRN